MLNVTAGEAPGMRGFSVSLNPGPQGSKAQGAEPRGYECRMSLMSRMTEDLVSGEFLSRQRCNVANTPAVQRMV
jgi:hypothetical protein